MGYYLSYDLSWNSVTTSQIKIKVEKLSVPKILPKKEKFRKKKKHL